MKIDVLIQNPKKLFVLFLVVSFIFFGNGIKNGFSLDDSYITVSNYPIPGQFYKPNNELVSKGISAIPQIWQSRYAHDGEASFDYRPLVATMFAIEYSIFGQNPYVNHLINIIIYACVIFLVFTFTQLILIKIKLPNSELFAFICALIFLIHPSHSEVVNNIKCRDELLASAFGFLASIKSFQYFDSKKVKYIIFAVIFISLGFFAKLSAVLFLPIIPLTIYFFYNSSLKKAIISFILILLCYQLHLLIKKYAVTEIEIRNFYHFENPLFTGNASLITKLIFAITTFGFYIKLMFFPYPLCYYYGSNMLNPHEPFTIYFFISLVSILVSVIYYFKTKNNLFLYGVLFFILGLSPFVNLLTPVAGIVGERFSFIASYGFTFAITSIVLKTNTTSYLSLNKNLKFALYAIFTVTFIYTFNRNKVWESKLSLFENDSKNLEKSAKANSLLGNEYFEILFLNKEKDNVKKLTPPQLAELCVKHYNLAINADSSIFSCYNNLGVIYYSFYNDIKLAKQNFQKAIYTKPNYPQAYENLGNCHKKMNNIALASRSYIMSISQNPKQFSAYLEIIRLYFDNKQYKVSLRLVEIALKQFPNDYELLVEKSNSYMMLGELNTCLVYFEQAYNVKQNKRLAQFLNSKYLSLNDTTKALFYKKEYEKLSE